MNKTSSSKFRKKTLLFLIIKFPPLKFLFKRKPSNLKSIDQLFEDDLASVQEIGIDGRVEEVRVNNFSNT